MVTIGITTFNRYGVLKMMAESLYASTLPKNCNIKIYDDASTEYDEDDIKKLFPTAIKIKRNKINLKSDKNIYSMYLDFLSSKDEVFVNADSDLIFKERWLLTGLELLEKTDGILSLYNSIVISGTDIDEQLVEKQYVGSAGVLMSRKCVEKIIDKFSMDDIIGDIPFFDWHWSSYLRKEGYRIYSVKNSLVQHIGYSGQNSSRMIFDYGEGFRVEDSTQGQIINDILLKLAIRDKSVRSWYALFPFERIPIGARVVIYGYGTVGHDYVKQLRFSHYCDLVAVVDNNFATMNDVLSPNELTSLSFDYIILAMLDFSAQEEIKNNLMYKNKKWLDKIIVHQPIMITK